MQVMECEYAEGIEAITVRRLKKTENFPVQEIVAAERLETSVADPSCESS